MRLREHQGSSAILQSLDSQGENHDPIGSHNEPRLQPKKQHYIDVKLIAWQLRPVVQVQDKVSLIYWHSALKKFYLFLPQYSLKLLLLLLLPQLADHELDLA